MNKQVQFALIVWGLCCIPAAIYFSFPDHSTQNIGYMFPTSGTKGTEGIIQTVQGHYRLQMEPLRSPLETGKQTLKITLLKQEHALPTPLQIAVTMPMGKDLMSAPVENLKAVSDKGQYTIQTDFSMSGRWQVEVTPEMHTKPILLPFKVQDAT